MNYKESGVDYDLLDSLKRLAQTAARETVRNLPEGMADVPESIGESARVIDLGPFLLATLQEGLGTKDIVADSMAIGSKETRYDNIGWDTVAMIVNDLAAVGARPAMVNAHWAFGSSRFLEKNPEKATDLVRGWKEACQEAGALWTAGETPTLKGIIYPGRVELSGSGIGIIDPKERLTLGDKLKIGDHIVLIESNGVHANGLTLIRDIARTLPEGFRTNMPDGRSFGAAVLRPTHIYARFVQDLFAFQTDIHYMCHITGHGWRKIMRANRELRYVMHTIPEISEEFRFIQEKGHVTDKDMYQTFNMGAGFAVMVPERHVWKVQGIAEGFGFRSTDAGIIESGSKQVMIEPKGIVFSEDSMKIR